MGHILTPKNSPKNHLRTKNKVKVPRFNTYCMKNSLAFRAIQSIQSNNMNYTKIASKFNNLSNLDFQVESPQTVPQNNNDNFFLFY